MPSLPEILTARVCEVAGTDPELRPATKPQFGHFQSNVALRLAKAEGKPPREVAQRIVDALDVADICEPLEIAGPGFINFRLRSDVLAGAVSEQLADPRCGIPLKADPYTVVIDYSSPNVAKQMHVGHLRSTIIGDCFARVLATVGEKVLRRNHIGDWGRQFGMLIQEIEQEGLDLTNLDLAGAEALYKRANEHLNLDPQFAEWARHQVVLLQAGDPKAHAIWERLIEVSKIGFHKIYERLNVLLTDDDIFGESTYNDMLEDICVDLETRGIAVQDQGALVVFVEGSEAPAILRNSAGGYGYDVTDIAALKFRVQNLHADRVIYVTDARQAHHFQLIFAVARKAGYVPEHVRTEHVGFGMVLGPDGKPYKTRDGNVIRLGDLLDQAELLAAPEIALAAVKYADLSNQMQKDYVFDLAKMTSTSGDTGPYLQYAHARVSQILRKAAADGAPVGPITVLAEPAEQALALTLLGFGGVVEQVADNLTPHKLCNYLFDLATHLSSFYEQCPVLKSEGEVRTSRLGLCRATQAVLSHGLNLLGIIAPERM